MLVNFEAIWSILLLFGIFMAIWYISWPFGTFYGRLLYLVVILYIFPRFGMLCQEKIWQPCVDFGWTFVQIL
jgi:hypothetical protein